MTIGGQGAVLDLSGVTIVNGPATILANQNYETVKGTTGADNFQLAGSGDSVWGEGGADTFTLLGGYNGSNTIQGFSSSDVLDVSNFSSWTDFATLSNHTTEVGGNAVINFGGGATLTLAGVDASTLTASQFKFA